MPADTSFWPSARANDTPWPWSSVFPIMNRSPCHPGQRQAAQPPGAMSAGNFAARPLPTSPSGQKTRPRKQNSNASKGLREVLTGGVAAFREDTPWMHQCNASEGPPVGCCCSLRSRVAPSCSGGYLQGEIFRAASTTSREPNGGINATNAEAAVEPVSLAAHRWPQN